MPDANRSTPPRRPSRARPRSRSGSRSRTTVPGAVALLAVAVLAGCGDGETGENGETGQNGGPGSPETQDGASWQRLDACALLSSDEVAAALAGGSGGMGVTAEPEEDDPERPTCDWSTADGRASLEVKLWDPPLPEVLTEDRRTVPVGDLTGYVQTSTETSCFLQVAADGFWVGLDLDTTAETRERDYCVTRAAPVVQLVLDAAAG